MSANEAAAQSGPPSGVKKLRFDDAVTAAPPASDGCLGGGTTSGRSVLKGSPSTSTPPLSGSSLRRSSDTASGHGDAHVHVNPHPEVIEHDGSIATLAAVAMTEQSAGEVANFLADVGAGLNNGTSCSNLSVPSLPPALSGSPNASSALVGGASSSTADSAAADASERFRTLLLQLSALILEHRPKDPEQYIIDHLNARLLSASVISRVPANEMDASAVAGSAAARESATASHTQEPLSAAQPTAVFQPYGDTVVERLASNALSTEVGHALLLRVAEVLISAQPDDPEDFLWARFEARSFGEEASHNITVNAEGFPVVRPEDPAQLALLKDIPASSPGYVVALNLLPVLFAKKPTDPISYLFYHIGSRTRSSAAQSAHSSTHRLRLGGDEDEFEAESCTSREFGEDSDSGAEDAAESGSVGGSASQLALQRKGSLGSLFDAAAGQSLRRSAGERSAGSRQRAAHGVSTSRTSSVRRSMASASAASRVSREAHVPAAADELAAYANGGTKRVSIAQQEVQPTTPSQFSYNSEALPNTSGAGGPHCSARDSTSTAEPHAGAGAAPASGSALWRLEAGEQARVRQEFELLRLREELRLERLQYEVRTLTRECEYRTRMAVLNKTDRMADRAAAAAREALEEAHIYRGFLCAQIDQLEAEQQRQLRMLSQQFARMPSPTSALPSPALAPWHGDDAQLLHHGNVRESYNAAPAPSFTYGVPSELDILKKQVELLTMEQARAKYCGQATASQGRYYTSGLPGPQTGSRSPYPMQ